MAEASRHEAIVNALISDPEVTMLKARMFEGQALKTGGKTFAIIVNGKFVVKLPKQRVDALVGSGSGKRFDTGHGKVLREWLAVERVHEAMALAQEAKNVAGSGN